MKDFYPTQSIGIDFWSNKNFAHVAVEILITHAKRVTWEVTTGVNAKQKRSIPPLGQLLPLILLWIIFHFVYPVRIVMQFPSSLIGLAPAIVGLFINALATITLTRARGRLVTEGAFQYSRNPIYLGGIVFFFGLAILLGSLISFVFIAIMFLLMHFWYIPNEERELETMFGKEYLDYKKRVRKYI